MDSERIDGREAASVPEPIKVQVKIDHKNYHLVSTEPEAYLHKVAELVNGKLAEIESRNQFISTDVKMVLTALNLAEDVIKSQNETATLRQEMKELRAQVEEMEVELDCLREEEQNVQTAMFDKTGKPTEHGKR